MFVLIVIPQLYEKSSCIGLESERSCMYVTGISNLTKF